MNENQEDLFDEAAPEPAAVLPEEPLPDAPVRAILEALLFASEEPVTAGEVAGILGEERLGEIEACLDSLAQEYATASRGLKVQRLAGGFRITTDPGLGPFLRELVRARNRQRLSRAALETLAIVAYKQPITAPEIQEIRGVNPSAILNSLLDRRMVRILGRKKVVGKPFLYGTTREFLIRFGLNSLGDLPSMEEFAAMLEPEPGDVAAGHGDHGDHDDRGDHDDHGGNGAHGANPAIDANEAADGMSGDPQDAISPEAGE